MAVDIGRSISEIVAAGERTYSFEFFPPKDETGAAQLWQAITELEPYRPTFVSVTYGAGGGTRDLTVQITERIARETTMVPVAHLTCVGHTSEELNTILDELDVAGVRHVMALRGDPPGGPGSAWTPTEGGFSHASELVRLIKARAGAATRVGVAAFPEGHVDAESLEQDARVLREKYDEGAEFAITDMVLRASDYVGLLERADAAGAAMPIIPGIMPILGLRSMERMAELSRRELPREVVDRLTPLADDPAALRAEGIQIASELCETLLEAGAPGLHFYTLNRSKATREIWDNLRIEVPTA
ncbi:MAG: methylenetetrahydrofolate reductase [NAD(P)H] [Nocardioides sp.]|uniref:methylenetetrahydrofolate reductase [NAD(P)H] n=1 Tax=Nocardioides sp. TaxID=35761 RepID=UPI003F04AF40